MNFAPVTDALVTAAATAIIALLPRLFTWLKVSINGADNTLLRNAIGTASRRAVAAIASGIPTEDAIRGMVDYAKANLPDAIGRLGVKDATLRAMCAADLARLQEGRC